MKHTTLDRVGRGLLLAVCTGGGSSAGCVEAQGNPAEYYACPAGPDSTLPVHPRAAEYQAVLDQARAAGLPGAILLVRDPEGLWTGASGYADLASGVEMRPCHRMLVASNTKMMVATVVLSLVEEGRLDLDEPISRLLEPSLLERLEYSDRITVRQLLNHTSGLVNYTSTLPWIIERLDDPELTWTADECLEFSLDKDSYFAPGQGWEYSNTNYILLGNVIETVTGEASSVALSERVFAPLGLEGTTYREDDFGQGYVRGYFDLYGNGTVFDVTETLTRDCMSEDGGVISTAYDLSRFIDALLRERTLLSPQSLEQMFETIDENAQDGGRYGLGLRRLDDDDHGVSWGHSGGKFGFLSDTRYFPEQDVTIVFLSNGSGGNGFFDAQLEKIHDAVLR